jgi:hypothetical protein
MPEISSDIAIRIKVLNPQRQPLGGTVDIEFAPQDVGQMVKVGGADASKDIDVRGLQRTPRGLYQVTVTPTDVFKPTSQFVTVPASGFVTVEFIIDKAAGTECGPPGETDGVCIRIRVLNPQNQPLGGTVDIEFDPQFAGDQVNVKGVDASKDIDVKGLRRAPQGLYQVTVTPTDVFIPTSKSVNIPASGFNIEQFVIDKGTTQSFPPRQYDEKAISAELVVRLAGRTADGSLSPVTLSPTKVVWVDAGDEVLVHLDSIAVRILASCLLVSVDFETDQTGRTPLIVSLALSTGRDAGGLVAATDELPRGNGALAARWGPSLQAAVWASLLGLAQDSGAQQNGVPRALTLAGGKLNVQAGLPLRASQAAPSSRGDK